MVSKVRAITDGILVRLGSLISAGFLGYGIEQQHVDVAVPAILVLVGVGVDMITGHFVKKAGR